MITLSLLPKSITLSHEGCPQKADTSSARRSTVRPASHSIFFELQNSASSFCIIKYVNGLTVLQAALFFRGWERKDTSYLFLDFDAWDMLFILILYFLYNLWTLQALLYPKPGNPIYRTWPWMLQNFRTRGLSHDRHICSL